MDRAQKQREAKAAVACIEVVGGGHCRKKLVITSRSKFSLGNQVTQVLKRTIFNTVTISRYRMELLRVPDSMTSSLVATFVRELALLDPRCQIV